MARKAELSPHWYVHDVVTGEFIDAGVMHFAPTAKALDAKCTNRYGRLTNMFSDVNGEYFRRVTKFI